MKTFWFIILTLTLLFTSLTGESDLPDDHFYPGWKKAAGSRSFKKADLFNHINGAAELFLEFGFADLRVQRYRGEKQEMSLELYRMENPTAALGIYLCKCGQETPLPGIPARHSADPYQFTILKGSYFIQVNNASGEKKLLPVMKELTARVVQDIPTGEPVTLLSLLPTRDLLPGSGAILRGPFALQKIFFFGEGDILQLQGKHFAVAGDYKDAVLGSYTMILIPFPDRGATMSAFRHLNSNLDSYITVVKRNEQALIFKDFKGKFGSVTIEGLLMRIKVNLAKTE
ncbi:DUF6599 family protein [Acidobacteriota bacterium]